MKKIFLTLVVTVLFVPVFVSADSYNGPFCFEDKSMTNNSSSDYDRHDIENVRGTCKEIETKTIVSIDPVLQKDYFLGTHAPIGYRCDPVMGCEGTTKYSENLLLTSSSTMESKTDGVDESPFHYALFGKIYFVPILSKMFREKGISFSENNMPNLEIDVLRKDEVDEIQKTDSTFYSDESDSRKTDTLSVQSVQAYSDSLGRYTVERYTVKSFNYQEYGKYIYAPKDDLVESQYVDVEKGVNMLSDKDLQIEVIGVYKSRTAVVVPITSPLKSVTNYWLYTKKNGKIAFVWQKSEYVLDNGQVKVVTGADKNISAALLFSNDFPAPVTTAHSLESASSTANTSVVLPIATEQKRGFFSRILDVIISWFR